MRSKKYPIISIYLYIYTDMFVFHIHNITFTSSTAQGGDGSFNNLKPIGRVGCCESRMVERIR